MVIRYWIRIAVASVISIVTFGLPQSTIEINVANNGFSSYSFDGEMNKTLTLIRGNTYIFHINAAGHPFWIKTISSTGTGNSYDDGITGNGTSNGDLTFTVPGNAPDQLFYNCQFHSSMNGIINITSTVDIDEARGILKNFQLNPNFPNPFNPETTISYILNKVEKVNVSVISINGAEIIVLFDGYQKPGLKSVKWSGADSRGRKVSGGVYVYRISVGNEFKTGKMVLLK